MNEDYWDYEDEEDEEILDLSIDVNVLGQVIGTVSCSEDTGHKTPIFTTKESAQLNRNDIVKILSAITRLEDIMKTILGEN